MAKRTDTHYVARTVVERVDRTVDDFGSEAAKRDVVEIASFTIKSENLENLKGKLANHIGLVEE